MKMIHLAGSARQEEAAASGTVKPGYLLEVTSSGAVKAHATQGGYAERAFALEDALQGRSIADDYADGARVTYKLELPGNVVNAVLKPGYNYAVGAALISAGDGTLKTAAGASSGVTVKQIVAFVEKAINLTASGAVATRSPVRVA